MSGYWRGLDPWQFVLLVGLLAQLLKLALYGAANRRLHLRVLVTTNGMPSYYAVMFGCLSTVVALEQGWNSSLFVAVAVFGGIVMHDIVRVKGSVDRGQRAALLIAHTMGGEKGGDWVERMVSLLGDRRHRPLHIAVGAAVGILCGLGWQPS